MKNLGLALKKIYTQDKIILVMFAINLLLSIILFVMGVTSLNPENAVVKTGYGDIGGYRSGPWSDMIAFPLLAVVYGILHSVIALRIYHQRGAAMTKFFLLCTAVLILGTAIVLLRLTERF